MGQENSRLVKESLAGYFFEQLHAAARHQKLDLSPFVFLYLVNLLSRYTRDGRDLEEEKGPLALLYMEALNLGDEVKRRQLLRDLGDFSLFVSGFFAESFPRRLMDKNYYMQLGGKAYDLLALRLPPERHEQAEMFRDLSRRFAALAELLGEVSEKGGGQGDRRLLALYEKYLHTGNQRLRRRLIDLGLLQE